MLPPLEPPLSLSALSLIIVWISSCKRFAKRDPLLLTVPKPVLDGFPLFSFESLPPFPNANAPNAPGKFETTGGKNEPNFPVFFDPSSEPESSPAVVTANIPELKAPACRQAYTDIDVDIIRI